MKLAIIGSRGLITQNIDKYISEDVTEIVSGGAKGIDSCAAEYANKNGIKFTLFLPDYTRYKKGAPLKRNEEIANYADECLAFWDGESRGTKYTVDLFLKKGKKVIVVQIHSDT